MFSEYTLSVTNPMLPWVLYDNHTLSNNFFKEWWLTVSHIYRQCFISHRLFLSQTLILQRLWILQGHYLQDGNYIPFEVISFYFFLSLSLFIIIYFEIICPPFFLLHSIVLQMRRHVKETLLLILQLQQFFHLFYHSPQIRKRIVASEPPWVSCMSTYSTRDPVPLCYFLFGDGQSSPIGCGQSPCNYLREPTLKTYDGLFYWNFKMKTVLTLGRYPDHVSQKGRGDGSMTQI